MGDTVRAEDWHAIIATQDIFSLINIISLTCSILLTLFVGSCIGFKYKASTRLSFKLYLFLALADALNHAALTINYNNQVLTCQIISLLVFFSNYLSVFITTVIAFNLQVVFILDKSYLVRSFKVYIIICFAMSLILCIPIGAFSFLNLDYCPYFTKYEYPINLLVMFFTFGIWMLLPTLYCFVVFIHIIIKLNHFKKQSNDTIQLKRMVTRLVLYPLVPVIVILPYIIVMIVKSNNPQYSLSDLTVFYFCQSVQGILNFIFFAFDPALPPIYYEFKQRSSNGSTAFNSVPFNGALEISNEDTLCENNWKTPEAAANDRLLL